jgi:hypothetical protein
MPPASFPLLDLPIELAERIIVVLAESTVSQAYNLSLTCREFRTWVTTAILHTIVIHSYAQAEKLLRRLFSEQSLIGQTHTLSINCYLDSHTAERLLIACRPSQRLEVCSTISLLSEPLRIPELEVLSRSPGQLFKARSYIPSNLVIAHRHPNMGLECQSLESLYFQTWPVQPLKGILKRISKTIKLLVFTVHAVDFTHAIRAAVEDHTEEFTINIDQIVILSTARVEESDDKISGGTKLDIIHMSFEDQRQFWRRGSIDVHGEPRRFDSDKEG